MSSQTSLGRVQPLYRGTYDATTTYNRLDNVFYDGETWVCKVDSVSGITPADGNYWQKVAGKGAQGEQGITGSFGTPTGSAEVLPSGSDPTVTVSASGPDTAKVFNFEFGIPAGPVGYDDVAASATPLSAGSTPTAEAELVESGGQTVLSFEFGIPAADGSGIKSIDGDITPDASGNATLTAVRYGSSQTLSDAQKLIARQNIGAIADPASKTVGDFLQYAGNNTWITKEVDVFPTGGRAGYYLSKTNDATEWAPVHMVPAGGTINSVLTKSSSSDYDLIWTTIDAIADSDIDDILSE